MAVYTFNQLTTFERCPRRYFYRYERGAEAGAERSAESIVAECVVATLIRLYEAVPAGAISRPNLIRAFRRACAGDRDPPEGKVHGEGPGDDAVAAVERGAAWIRSYYNRYQPFRDARTIGVRVRIEVPLPRAADSAAPDRVDRIVTTVDRLALGPDGTLELHDFDTARLAEDDHVTERLVLAARATATRRRVDPGDVEIVRHLLREDREIRLRPDASSARTARRSTEELVSALEQQRGRRERAYPTRVSERCEACAYRDRCPAYRDQVDEVWK